MARLLQTFMISLSVTERALLLDWFYVEGHCLERLMLEEVRAMARSSPLLPMAQTSRRCMNSARGLQFQRTLTALNRSPAWSYQPIRFTGRHSMAAAAGKAQYSRSTPMEQIFWFCIILLRPLLL